MTTETIYLFSGSSETLALIHDSLETSIMLQNTSNQLIAALAGFVFALFILVFVGFIFGVKAR